MIANVQMAIKLMILLFSAAICRSEWTGTVPRMNGVNVAGLEFGTDTNGGSSGSYSPPELSQIKHFVSVGMNIIRISFCWQSMQVNMISSNPFMSDEINVFAEYYSSFLAKD